jgi:ABC-type antimicrobial peptide transport system permease subunit
MLKPIPLHILLALADADCHGYAVMQAIRAQSNRSVAVQTASFYRHLGKLIDEGWVAEAFVRRFASGQNVIGQHVTSVIPGRLNAFIVGVVNDSVLAALGVSGVTAYSVGRRPEIAVRMALGASPGSVVRLVLGRVATLILAGGAIGVALSLWAAKFAGALLFGIDARDLMTLVAAAVVLVTVGLFAGWLPARKVSRLDPTTALRS